MQERGKRGITDPLFRFFVFFNLFVTKNLGNNTCSDTKKITFFFYHTTYVLALVNLDCVVWTQPALMSVRKL